MKVRSRLVVQDQYRSRVLEDEVDCNRIETFYKRIPAGESRCQILDDLALVTTTNSQFVFLESSVEGVQWWPIDSATPRVNANTDPFGPIFNWTTGSVSHNHGALSSTFVLRGHPAGSTTVHGDQFPIMQDYPVDLATPSGIGAVYKDTAAGPSANVPVHDNGLVLDLTPPAAGVSRYTGYFWGMNTPRNFGEYGDGLGFNQRIYCEDITQFSASPGFSTAFNSYPFVVGRENIDQIPATTPLGDATWGTTDVNLCIGCTDGVDAITNRIGWNIRTGAPGAEQQPWLNMDAAPAFVPPADTVFTYFWSKRAATGDSAATGNYIPFTGDGVWSKVTLVSLRASPNVGGTARLYLINADFGPPPGLLRELRPFDYFSDVSPWSASSLPAVGLQNPTSRDAVVKIVYGTL